MILGTGRSGRGALRLMASLSLLLKSLQLDREQTAALTEANEELKKQMEELQREATR